MGIAKSALELLCRTIVNNKFLSEEASVLQLGRQSVLMNRRSCSEVLERYRFPVDGFGESSPEKVSDVSLFGSLGFKVTDSIDVSDYENPTIIADLNMPVLSSVRRRYDLIFDGGTSEHVFNIPAFLMNVSELCRIHGLVVHSVPVNNWPDHGYYQFSPTFLTDFYTANNWRVVDNYIVKSKYEVSRRWELFPYKPGSVDYITAGGGGSDLFSQWLVVQKLDESSGDKMPQQSRYFKVWAPSLADKTSPVEWTESLLSRAKAVLRQYPRVRAVIMYFYVRIILRNKRPKSFKV